MSQTNRPAPPPVNSQRLLERFLQYVQIETTADPQARGYPTSSGQWTLGELLRDQLVALNLRDVHQDEHGLVWATIPATDGGNSATVALLAHMDTSPEASGRDVHPRVVPNFDGQAIELEKGGAITPDNTPELTELKGKTLIVTDGTTLLGGDDKAGVAILVELAAHLMEHPHLPHGPIRLLFTCDEEVGRGTEKIDLEKVDATVAYTLDGGGAGQLDVETFSADAAQVTFQGTNIHPAIAKDRMVNAVRAAAYFVEQLPRTTLAPETTDGRQAFVHPHGIEGGVGKTTVDLILRSFETADLTEMADRLRSLAVQTESEFPGLKVEVTTRQQYRNLRDGLQKLPEALALAEQAFANLQRPCERAIIRGGTDGSQLTERGLPTPNLSSGQHNIHANIEFACLEEMVEATEHLVEMLRLWSEQSRV